MPTLQNEKERSNWVELRFNIPLDTAYQGRYFERGINLRRREIEVPEAKSRRMERVSPLQPTSGSGGAS